MPRHVFGPVPSRRLGRSLGIDLTPAKTCSYDCRYCQLAATTVLTCERHSFFPLAEVDAELREVLATIPSPDAFTFSGSGEPTLSADLGAAIALVRRHAPSGLVAVITNGSLLDRPDVRREIIDADRIMPTCSTVHDETFHRLHRPAPGIALALILDGLRALSQEYRGVLEVEVMLVAGMNDSESELADLAGYLRSLSHLSSIFINVPVRPPIDGACHPAATEAVARAEQVLGAIAPLVISRPPTQPAPTREPPSERAVLALLARHPCDTAQVLAALGGTPDQVSDLLQRMATAGKVHHRRDGEREFWLTN